MPQKFEEGRHEDHFSSPLDFVGLNVYTPQYVRASDSPQGYTVVPYPTSFPHMASPWILLGPESLYWAVQQRLRSVEAAWHLYYGERLLLGRCD